MFKGFCSVKTRDWRVVCCFLLCLQGVLREKAEGPALVWRQTWVGVPFPSSTSLDIGKVPE